MVQISQNIIDVQLLRPCLNIAQLKTDVDLIESGFVFVNGYYSDGDGGGGIFYWDVNSVEANDNGSIISVTGIVTGRWKRAISPDSWVSPLWYGATQTDVNIDASPFIQSCISFCKNNWIKRLEIPPNLHIKTSINLTLAAAPPGLTIRGFGKGSVVYADCDGYAAFDFTGNNTITFKDLCLRSLTDISSSSLCSCFYLFSRDYTNGSAGTHVLQDCSTLWRCSKAHVVGISSEVLSTNDCIFTNTQPGTTTCYFSDQNELGIISLYANFPTVWSGGNTVHKINGGVISAPGAGGIGLYYKQARDVSLHGVHQNGSGDAGMVLYDCDHIEISGGSTEWTTTHGLRFDGAISGVSISGFTSSADLYGSNSSSVTGLSINSSRFVTGISLYDVSDSPELFTDANGNGLTIRNSDKNCSITSSASVNALDVTLPATANYGLDRKYSRTEGDLVSRYYLDLHNNISDRVYTNAISTKYYSHTIQTIGSSGYINVDLSLGSTCYSLLTDGVTIGNNVLGNWNPGIATDFDSVDIEFIFKQDGTGGRMVEFETSWFTDGWAVDTRPNAISIIHFRYVAGIGFVCVSTSQTEGLNNITELRVALSNLTSSTNHFYVKSHTVFGDGGGGIFDVSPIGSYVDDGGVVITDGYYAAIRRLEGNTVTPEMWGCPVGTDATAAINSAIVFANTVHGVVSLNDRKYYATSVNLTGSSNIQFIGKGRGTIIEQVWHGSPGATYPLIDCAGMCGCKVGNLLLQSMAWSFYGMSLTRDTLVGSCNGNEIFSIYTESSWRSCPFVVVGAEECVYNNLFLFNMSGDSSSAGALFVGMNLAHLPTTMTSLYKTLASGTQSTLDNTFYGGHFAVGVIAGVSKVITLSGPTEVRFYGSGFYSADNVTGIKGIVYCNATDAMAGSYLFSGATFEAANTPVFYLEAISGYPLSYYQNFEINSCRKTSVGAWVTAEDSTVFSVNWNFDGTNVGGGNISIGVDANSSWNTFGTGGTSIINISTMATNCFYCGKYGTISLPASANFGCKIEYGNGDPSWDGFDAHEVWRTVLGGTFGRQLQIEKSSRALHSDSLVDGYGLILHSDGSTWSPAGPITDESYPVFRNSDSKWVPLTAISATPATATSTGSKGTVAFDDGYVYICKNENDWGRVIVDSFGNTNLAVRTNQKDITQTAVSLTSNSSTAILAVTITGLGNSKSYSGVVGARIIINTAGTPANCGVIDIIAGVYVITNGSGVATVTVTGTVNVDTSKLAAAISTATGTIAASTGGFSVYATRVAGITMNAKAEANLISLIEVL